MFELVFLGTAGSVPSVERGLPALLVGFGRHRVLVDCGEGTQRQLRRSGAGYRRIDRVLLTHADLDHVLGLGGLTATLALQAAESALAIHGGRRTLGFGLPYLVDAVRRPGAARVVIGDVEEPQSLVEAVRGADALVIEASFLARDADMARQRGHLTAAAAGRFAAACGVGALYLTHLTERYAGEEILAE